MEEADSKSFADATKENRVWRKALQQELTPVLVQGGTVAPCSCRMVCWIDLCWNAFRLDRDIALRDYRPWGMYQHRYPVASE